MQSAIAIPVPLQASCQGKTMQETDLVSFVKKERLRGGGGAKNAGWRVDKGYTGSNLPHYFLYFFYA